MKIVNKRLEDLKGAVYNPRKISPEQLESLKRSIKEFGFVEPVVWNETTGNIVGGHQRVRALAAMGEKSVDVVVVKMPLEKEKALNIALNKISGEFDLPLLKDLILDLDASNADLSLTGFTAGEIEDLMTAAPPPPMDEEEKPEDLKTVQVIKCPKCAHEFSILSKRDDE